MLISKEVLHDLVAQGDLLLVGGWLLEPFLEETGADLGLALV
jgi:3-phosphoglycerate kinase